jgi:2-polyprenyl-6-methoxyphenol hydroxylase-like FAD-dependent oxidoreductase
MKNVAVVVGGSIGGLLAGLVLAKVCDEVVLIERGELSDTPAPRPGVPQGMHAHGLLAGGLAALEELLPGLCRELEQQGCPTGDNLRDGAWVFAGRRLALGDSGVQSMTMARPVLEHAIRRRVAEVPNLRIRAGTRVNGLRYEAGRVTGVRVTPNLGGAEEDLAADLVVDASGRYSQLPEWLAALGLAPPRIEEVALETHYVSRIYSRRPHHIDGGMALVVVSDPASPRGGIALALDEQRWIVSQYAMGGQHPPQDHAGFVGFARTLASQALAEILEDAEPLGEARTLRFPSSIRRHYDKMRDFPKGLLVCADALSSFNPTFGQGITVAAKQALVLRDLCTRVPLAELGKIFLSRTAPIVDIAWNASVGRTFLYPGVVGRPTLQMRIANAYLPRVVARAHEDAQVATALLKVMHFLAPPNSLFAPWILSRVLLAPSKREKRAAVPLAAIAGPASSPSRLMSR